MNSEIFYSLERPLHTLPAHSQVSAVNLSHFPALVERLGGESRDILEHYGIDPQVLSEDNRFIDCQPFVDMFEHCAEKLNAPLFGLQLAQMQDADTYGFVSALCRSAGTIRQGIQGLIEYLPVVHSTESVLELVEGETISELRWTEQSDFGANDQANCQGLLLNLKVLRSMAGTGFVPRYVSVSDSIHRRASDDLETIVACPVRASKERSCIAFSSALLDQYSIGSSRPLFELLSGYLARLKSFQNPSLLDKVNDFISEGLITGAVSIDACAGKLGLSPRVLQLRLKALNVSYSDILDSHRLERARHKLRHSRLSIAEIADQLGYAERTSFGRAFKRWTGLSPQQFRSQ